MMTSKTGVWMRRAGMVAGRVAMVLAALAMVAGLAHGAEKKAQGPQKPVAGPRGTSLRVAWLYVRPEMSAQKVDKVQVGRELVVAERSGTWLRVFANTDQQLEQRGDVPMFGEDELPPPLSGWMPAKGVVIETNAGGDLVLMGEAASQEQAASDPRGPVLAARNARLLYRRLVEFYPQSVLAAEAAWRSAEIQWQLDKAEAATRPSARERDAYLRAAIDEEAMKKVIKSYPGTRQSEMAAYALLDNKLCGDWQGQAKCPEKESELYEKYAAEHPEGARTAQALYQAVYRQAVLTDMALTDGNARRAEAARTHARELAGRLKEKFPQSDSAARAAALVYKLEEGLAVYGSDRD